MKRVSFLIAVALVAIVLLVILNHLPLTLMPRSQPAIKQAALKDRIQLLEERGGNTAPIEAIVDQMFEPASSGHSDRTEALLDQAIAMADAALRALPPSSQMQLPLDNAPEPKTDLYSDPQSVTIAGYEGDAMEPFISPDGNYLFFNNSNASGVDTNLYWAERNGPLSFRSLGELPGVNSPFLDAVPSLDTAGHFYFTTLREFDRTRASVYVGDFDSRGVHNVHPVPGHINPIALRTVNMDTGISPDGQTLYISRAVIVPGAPAPASSILTIARLHNGGFELDPKADAILKNVNTGALAYAPCISANGLDLFFTRASRRVNTAGELEPTVRVLVATRPTTDVSFGTPMVLSSLTGFVEAPSVSLDEKELFFHKRVGNRYIIERAVRR